MYYIVLVSRYPSFDYNSLVHSGNHIRDQETATRHLNGACYGSETQATTTQHTSLELSGPLPKRDENPQVLLSPHGHLSRL